MPLQEIAIGAQLASTLFGLGAERAARKRRERALLNAAERAERRATQAELGGQSLITQQQSSVRSTLGDLASRGVLDSSFAAPEIAAAAAPFEAARQSQVDTLEQRAEDLRLAAATEGAAAPGFSDFAGGILGDVGGFAALRAGQREQAQRGEEFFSRLERIFQPPTPLTSRSRRRRLDRGELPGE